MDNQLQFVDGAQLFANDDLEEEFAVGEGGLRPREFSIERKQGEMDRLDRLHAGPDPVKEFFHTGP